MDRSEVDDRFSEVPFHQLLDLSLERFDDEAGVVEISMPFRAELARAGGESFHGGVLASLLDTAATYAAIAAVGTGVPTINLEVDYMRPTSPAPVLAEGRVLRAGSTVVFAASELAQEYQGEMTTVARGRGLFSTAHVD